MADVALLDEGPGGDREERRRWLFRHSSADIIPVVVCLAYPCLLVLTAVFYDRLPWYALLGLAHLMVLLWVVGSWGHHHHGHLNFFRSNVLNRAFEICVSAGWRTPHSRETYQHKIHHTSGYLATVEGAYHGGHMSRFRRIVDYVGLTSGRHIFYVLFDILSLRWLISVPWKAYFEEEHPTTKIAEAATRKRRSVLSWRRRKSAGEPEPGEWVAFAKSRGQLGQILLECVAMVVFGIVLLSISVEFCLFVYMPVSFVAYVVYAWSDLADHLMCDLRYDEVSSTSSYNRWYNLILLNGGYHAEHHWRDGIHWTRIPQVRDELVDESQRRVVNFTLLNPLLGRTPLVSTKSRIQRSAECSVCIADIGADSLRVSVGSESRTAPKALGPVLELVANSSEAISVEELCREHQGVDQSSIIDVLDWLLRLQALELIFEYTQRTKARLNMARTLPNPMPEEQVRQYPIFRPLRKRAQVVAARGEPA